MAEASWRIKALSPCAEFLTSSDEGQPYYIRRPNLLQTAVGHLLGEATAVTTVWIKGRKIPSRALARIQLELEDLYERFGQTTYQLREFKHWPKNEHGNATYVAEGVEQIVLPLNDDDRELIRYSDVDSRATEFGRVRFFDKDGQLLSESPVFTSFEHSSIEGDSFTFGIHKANDKLPTGKIVSYVELVHTHPTYELIGSKNDISFSLSPADVNLGRFVQTRFIKAKVIMTAVLPNGYVYASLLRGETTPEELRVLNAIRPAQ